MRSAPNAQASVVGQTIAMSATGCLNLRMLSIALVMGSAVVVMTTSGCGRKSRLSVAPVHGRVTYKGQGVPRATVILSPVGETADSVKRLRPFGYADDQGNFQL